MELLKFARNKNANMYCDMLKSFIENDFIILTADYSINCEILTFFLSDKKYDFLNLEEYYEFIEFFKKENFKEYNDNFGHMDYYNLIEFLKKENFFFEKSISTIVDDDHHIIFIDIIWTSKEAYEQKLNLI